MEKYLALEAFSLLDKTLIVPEDIIYAEPVRLMMHIYSPKTKKFIGKVKATKFKELALQISNIER